MATPEEIQLKLLELRARAGQGQQQTPVSPGSAGEALGQAGGRVGSTLAQVPYGFNERLGQIIGAGSRIDPLRPVYEATGIPQPSRELAEWLTGQQMAPEATTGPERVMRSGGEMLAETVMPAGALQVAASRAARPAVSLGERVTEQLLGAYRQAPAAVQAGEVASATAAGMGGQIGEEIAPGSTAARITGEFVGGLAGPTATLPMVRAGARGVGALTRNLGSEAQARRAREYVAGQLGEHLASEQASQGLRRAEDIAREAPGFEPSLAQRTRVPALVETQRALERGASGAELDQAVARHQQSARALQQFARREAPEGQSSAEVALDPLLRGREQAARQARAIERQKAQLAEQRAPGALQTRRQAIEDQEREALRALRERTTGQRQDIAAGIERVDRGAIGERLRGAIQGRRSAALERMGQLSAQMGLDDVDVTVPYEGFYQALQRWSDGLLPSQRDNLPESFKDVRALGERAITRMETMQSESPLAGDVMGAREAAPPVTFREIKALREAVTDEWLEAMRDTSPGHRKRLANVTRLRNMIDSKLLGEELDLAQPGLSDAYRNFRRRYLEEVIQPFERGAVKEVRRADGTGFYRTLDEDVASKALQSQDAARQFRQVLGDDPDAMADLTRVAIDDLANAAVRDGVVRLASLENWLVKRRAALEEIPEVRSAVQRIVTAVRDVETAHKAAETAIKDRGLSARRGVDAQRRQIETAEQNLDEAMRPLLERMGALNERQMALEDTMLSRRLAAVERGTQRADQVIDDALRNPRLMARLWGQVHGHADARQALRRHIWDGLTTLDGGELSKFLDQNQQSLKVAFGDEHLKKLRMIADGLQMLESVPAPITARPISPDPAERLKELTGADPSSLAARYLAVRRGRSSRWVEGFAGFMNWLRQRGKLASDELMKRALYDPDVARALVDSVNLSDAKAPRSKLRAWMFAMGVAAPVEEFRE